MNLFELSYRSTPKREVFMAIRGSGQLKVEFYSHLDEIKDLYFNQGFVVFKILHQKVIEKYNLTLDYQAFCYHARKELKKVKPINSLSKELIEKSLGLELEAQKSSTSKGNLNLNSEPKLATIEASPPISKIKKNTRAVRESI